MRAALLLCALAVPLSAATLVTPFIDVHVADVRLGEPTPVTVPGGDGLLLFNRGTEALRVRVEARVPTTGELREALPIPDPAWIEIEPRELDIPVGGSALARLRIRVPKQAAFRRRTYQVMIWTRTVPPVSTGVSLQGGLASRLRFTTKK